MLIDTIRFLTPNADCVIVGEPTNAHEYIAQVTWRDERPQPTWAEIQAARPGAETAQANATAQVARRQAYTVEADPLFFAWRRGETTEQEWLDKCAEIRDRYPYAEP